MSQVELVSARVQVRLQPWIQALRSQRVNRPAIVVIGLLSCVTAYFVAQIWGPTTQQFDLKIYFRAVNYWFDGNDIYNYTQADPIQITLGFTYPPLAALLMSPMAVLPFAVVQALTIGAILAAGFGCAYIVVRALHPGTPADAWQLALAGAVTVIGFATQPWSQTLQFGQVNLFLGVLVLVDLLVLVPRRSRLGGVGIGLAMAIKLTPGVFLGYLLLSRRWRESVTALITAAGVTALAAALTPAASWRFFTSLIWDTQRVGLLDNAANQSLNGLLARIVAPDAPPKLVWFALVIALVTAGAVRARRAILAGDHLLAVTVIGLVGVLISPVSWVHHAVWATLALVLMVRYIARSLTDPRVNGPALRRLVLPVVLLAAGYLVWCVDTRVFFQLPTARYADASPLQVLGSSLPLLWMLAAVLLLPIDRTVDPRAGAQPALLVNRTKLPSRSTIR